MGGDGALHEGATAGYKDAAIKSAINDLTNQWVADGVFGKTYNGKFAKGGSKTGNAQRRMLKNARRNLNRMVVKAIAAADLGGDNMQLFGDASPLKGIIERKSTRKTKAGKAAIVGAIGGAFKSWHGDFKPTGGSQGKYGRNLASGTEGTQFHSVIMGFSPPKVSAADKKAGKKRAKSQTRGTGKRYSS